MATLGVVIISLKGMKYLLRCVESARWADVVVVLHVGEGEPAIRGENLPSSISLRRVGSVEEATRADEKIGTDWILHLWGEEKIEPELKEELEALRKREGGNGPSSFRIPIRSRLLDRWVDGSLWDPSPALRLSRRGASIFPGRWLMAAGKAPQAAGLLAGSISDYASAELSDGIDRIQSVSGLWAGQLGTEKSDAGSFRIAFRALRVLTRRLLSNGLFSRGLAGLTLSVLAAYAALLSGAKAWEAKQSKGKEKREKGKGRSGLPRRVEEWIWGSTPKGFRRVSRRRKQMMTVREGLEVLLGSEKFRSQMVSKKEESSLYGRGRLRLVQLDNGETVLVRPYRHGGVFRHLTGSLFATWPPRPFKELAVTEEARRRGIWTLEICGAWVERVWGPFYRGWLITRELAGAQDLWAVLQNGFFNGEEKRLFQAVARSVRRMHRSGIYHGDLNLKNIMVRRNKDEITTYIIDFDKARIFPMEVPPDKAQKNLRRLLRSICKLDPDRRHLSQEDWDLFIRFYSEAAET